MSATRRWAAGILRRRFFDSRDFGACMCRWIDEWRKMSLPVQDLFYRAVKEVALGIHDFPPDRAAYDLALAASMTPGSPYYKKPVRELEAAWQQPIDHYESGAPCLHAFFDANA